MKKLTLFILLFVMLINNLNAQWYQNDYGVLDLNDLTEEQLRASYHKAQYMRNIGVTVMLIGTGAAIGGTVMWRNIDFDGENIFIMITSVILSIGGEALAFTGITLTGIYSFRILNIKGAANFKNLPDKSLSITPVIDYNQHINTYSTGLSMVLNF